MELLPGPACCDVMTKNSLEQRFKVLNGKNNYKAVFVERIEEIETAQKEVKTEKAVKKTTKKAK